MVNDQGAAVDDIEANITRASDRTRDAATHVVHAERSQRSAQKKWCFLMALAAAVVFVLLLVLLA